MSGRAVLDAMIDALNAGDVNRQVALLAEGATYVNADLPEPTDREGWRRFHEGLSNGFPDLRYRVTNLVDAGDSLVAECEVAGTHQGEFAGLPPTRKPVRLRLAFVLDVADGRITRWASYYDRVGILRQLGVLPAEP